MPQPRLHMLAHALLLTGAFSLGALATGAEGTAAAQRVTASARIVKSAGKSKGQRITNKTARFHILRALNTHRSTRFFRTWKAKDVAIGKVKNGKARFTAEQRRTVTLDTGTFQVRSPTARGWIRLTSPKGERVRLESMGGKPVAKRSR